MPEIAIIARVGAHKAFEAAGLKPEKTEVLAHALWRRPAGAFLPA